MRLYDPAGVGDLGQIQTAGAVDDGDGGCRAGGKGQRLFDVDIAVLSGDRDGVLPGRNAHIAGGRAGIQQIDHTHAVHEDSEGRIAMCGVQEADGGIARGDDDGVIRQGLNAADDAAIDDGAAGRGSIAGEDCAALAGVGQRDDWGSGSAFFAGEDCAAFTEIGQRCNRNIPVFHKMTGRRNGKIR